LADPPTVKESIQITRHALDQYRRLRARGEVDDMTNHPEVALRMEELLPEVRTVVQAIDRTIRHPITADGLYEVFARGFLVTPYLWECREELRPATQWQTRLIRGSVKVVDQPGRPLPAIARIALLSQRDLSPELAGDAIR